MTYWISLPYATFGLVASEGRITLFPPIAKWTRGKPEGDVIRYYARKNAKIIKVL